MAIDREDKAFLLSCSPKSSVPSQVQLRKREKGEQARTRRERDAPRANKKANTPRERGDGVVRKGKEGNQELLTLFLRLPFLSLC